MRAIFKGFGKVVKVLLFGGVIVLNFILEGIGLLIGAITKQ